VFIVVVAVFEMPLSITSTARHGPYRQHDPTLTLFEFAMQLLSCLAALIAASMQKPTGPVLHPVCPYCNPCCLNLQSSFRLSPAKSVLAALVLKIDTIPKPDGLGWPTLTTCLEQNSIDFGSCSRRIEGCSIAFDQLTGDHLNCDYVRQRQPV
jgi:hypothetical protein